MDCTRPPDRQREVHHRPPLQFGVGAVLLTAVPVGLLFGLLRWLEVPTLASVVVLVILIVSTIAAAALVAAIAVAREDRPNR